ncbi:hypothetical protein [Streptomyces sp. SLBN-118]|uniref:hypothetical protein n=1 Tax=Streptomyces sp. SLBN-118 TaxID=2768454 RepID=UPI001150ADD1|nr:hypothetical protein [Streptomyces sp. SLBN-118]
MTEYVSGRRLFRVVQFQPSHRQLMLWSEALAVDETTTRVEVWIAHVELMFLKPYYRDGLHVRRATAAEFAELRERHGLAEKDAEWTWMLAPDDGSFVVGGQPSWREAEYALMDRESLFDFSKPWPPAYPAQWGEVG